MEEQNHPCFMAQHLFPHSQSEAEDEFIDIDLTSAASTPPRLPVVDHFEFQMSSAHHRNQPLTSPADELFYRGQLLPILPPPRQQLVEKLHELTCPGRSIIVSTPPSTSTRATTPFASCTVSPAASCYASGELRPEDYSGESSYPRPRKRWSKSLSFIKQLTLGSKLKASKVYLKSLFTKSGNPDKKSDDTMHLKKEKKKTPRPPPFVQVEMRRHTSTKSLPTSSLLLTGSHSTSFSGVNLSAPFKRSSSVSSDMESSVQGAIAYCKKSQQMAAPSRKSASDASFCLITACKVSPPGQKHDSASCNLWRR